MSKQTRGIGDKWIKVCKLLNSHDAEYIVVGGVAVNLHGYLRATRDLDILVPRNTTNTRQILEALGELPYGLARELDAETVDKKPITIIGDDPRVDILKSAGPLSYQNATDSAVTTVIQGVVVRYASLDDLIRSKKTDRDQDKADGKQLQRLSRGPTVGPSETDETFPKKPQLVKPSGELIAGNPIDHSNDAKGSGDLPQKPADNSPAPGRDPDRKR